MQRANLSSLGTAEGGVECAITDVSGWEPDESDERHWAPDLADVPAEDVGPPPAPPLWLEQDPG